MDCCEAEIERPFPKARVWDRALARGIIMAEGNTVNGIATAALCGSSSEIAAADILRWTRESGAQAATDKLAREEPLEIRVRGQCVVVTMRTPGNDPELAVGFLLGEGVVRRREDVLEAVHCRVGEAAEHDNILNVFLSPAIVVDFDKAARHVYASSSCGLCGKTSIESVHQHFDSIASRMELGLPTLLSLPDRLREAQRTFTQTGGLHAAAIFDKQGNLLVLREDVGRHNAVDKALGHALLNRQLPLSETVLLVSGRASFEIMQKALAARIPCVAALSAPSSLAVEFAKDSNQTLVGFLRGHSLNIYSGAERIANRALPNP
jgi:FdhD protein